MIILTENAKNYLSSVAKDDYVTLGVNGGGCSGFQYVWDYKKNWPNVKWSEPYDNCLVLDPMAEMFVAGCTIDYVTELGGSYLKVINPTQQHHVVVEKVLQFRRKICMSIDVK